MDDTPLLRPSKLDDLSALITFSQEAGIGVTSLPRHASILEKKLLSSQKTFNNIPSSGHYLFCLEFQGKVVGTSAIFSRIGLHEPFFAYHLLSERKHSEYLGIDCNIDLLHFIRARKKPTEIGTLFLKKDFRKKDFGKLLSFGRFLFIAAFPHLFAPVIIAELRGVNHNGISPFWNAIGKPFFNIDFSTADLLRTAHPECIQELFPRHPLYLNLLPQEAQEVVGKAHAETLPAKALLERQGFRMSHYLDIFDGGPHLYAFTNHIQVVKQSRLGKIKRWLKEEGNQSMLLSNDNLDFRACVARGTLTENGDLLIPEKIGAILKVNIQNTLRCYVL